MKQSNRLQLLLLALPTFTGCAVTPIPPAWPKMVLIFMDGLGCGDLGIFGFKSNHTPTLDRMASKDLKLTSICAAPVCSVSCAQVMTGAMGHRPHHFIKRGVIESWEVEVGGFSGFRLVFEYFRRRGAGRPGNHFPASGDEIFGRDLHKAARQWDFPTMKLVADSRV